MMECPYDTNDTDVIIKITFENFRITLTKRFLVFDFKRKYRLE